jgi:hypothetical protein
MPLQQPEQKVNNMKKFRELSSQIKEKDEREYDYEGDMAKTQLKTIIRNAETIHDMLEDDENLPEWVQSKITLAKDYIVVAANYLQSEMDESSSAYDRINARFKKLSGRSMGDAAKEHGEEAKRLQKEIDAQKAENERRQAAMKKEEVEQLDEKNKPTNPELWSRAVSLAKSKFDVYPSAYANGWAAKWYKSKGGGWRSVSESVKNDDLPFTPDKPKKKSVVVGKKPEGYSIARQLARQAMQKQMQKMNKPVKEETNKAKIVKDMLKKKNSSEDAFQKEPELSSTLTKGF